MFLVWFSIGLQSILILECLLRRLLMLVVPLSSKRSAIKRYGDANIRSHFLAVLLQIFTVPIQAFLAVFRVFSTVTVSSEMSTIFWSGLKMVYWVGCFSAFLSLACRCARQDQPVEQLIRVLEVVPCQHQARDEREAEFERLKLSLKTL